MTWSKQELGRIGQTDDLHIAPFREDGVTYGTPTWIWSVVVEGALYVRAYNGRSSRWYRAALKQRAGRILAAGPYLAAMVGARARAATDTALGVDSGFRRALFRRGMAPSRPRSDAPAKHSRGSTYEPRRHGRSEIRRTIQTLHSD
jgi:hypothetical protein